MKDCRTCPDFFEYADGFCTMPCKAEKITTSQQPIPDARLWFACLAWGTVGSFGGLVLLMFVYWMLN